MITYNENTTENILFKDTDLQTVSLNDIVVFEKKEEEWLLKTDDYIVGKDGQYYQYLYQGEIYELITEPGTNTSYTFVEDTVSESGLKDGYMHLMSNNKGISGSWAAVKISWNFDVECDLTFYYRSYAESTYDYVIITKDTEESSSIPSSSSTGSIYNTSGQQGSDFYSFTVNSETGEHWIWVYYRKDASMDSYQDRGFIQFLQHPILETISKQGNLLPSEYVYDNSTYIEQDGKYYQKLVRVYTLPDGTTVKNTDDYKLGEELGSSVYYTNGSTPGNIVYSISDKLTPIGIIAVDSDQTGDDSIRVVSFDYMNPNDPNNGSNTTPVTLYHGLDYGVFIDQTIIDNMSGPLNIDPNATYSPSDILYSSAPSITEFVDGHHDTKLVIDNISNDEWHTADYIDNTTYGQYTSYKCVWRYNILGLQGIWYLPSLHEQLYLGYNIDSINNALYTLYNDEYISYSTFNLTCAKNQGIQGARTTTAQQSWGGNHSKNDNSCIKWQYYCTEQDMGYALAMCKMNWKDKDLGTLELDLSYKY